MDADGFVTIVDRMKDMLISGGENVYPAEIENVLLGHPAIVDAAVIGVPSPKWGESPLAVVVATTGASITEDGLLDWRNELARRFKTVKRVEFVDRDPPEPQRQDPQARAPRAVQGRCARRNEATLNG